MSPERIAVLTASMLAVPLTGCGAPALAVAKAPTYEPEGQTKCAVAKSQAAPLIIEWPAAERTRLEAIARRGAVVVRYQGCELEILPQCQTSRRYSYTSTTPQDERVRIKDADQLYAHLPFGAARLEGTLARAGELNVSMSIVGTYEIDRAPLAADELSGSCAGATHVISALTVGAFEFSAGADASIKAEGTALGAGAGGKTTAQRETLNRGGSPGACAESNPDATKPPFGCGALLRIEVDPIQPSRSRPPPAAPERAASTPGAESRPTESGGANESPPETEGNGSEPAPVSVGPEPLPAPPRNAAAPKLARAGEHSPPTSSSGVGWVLPVVGGLVLAAVAATTVVLVTRSSSAAVEPSGNTIGSSSFSGGMRPVGGLRF